MIGCVPSIASGHINHFCIHQGSDGIGRICEWGMFMDGISQRQRLPRQHFGIRENLRMTAVARQSGISPQTLASKIQRGTALSEEERKAIETTFGSYGIP